METIATGLWAKSKLLVKAFIIGIMVLLLMIPTIYIRELIAEREARQKEAIAEVSSKWAGRQNLVGPIVVLPFWKFEGDTAFTKKRIKRYAYFLPDDLKIKASLTPQEKYRGIYKVLLYTSRINLSGSFTDLQPQQLHIPEADILWAEAFVQLRIPDAKGLNEEVKMNWNGQELSFSPDVIMDYASDGSMNAPLRISGLADLQQIRFHADLNLSGSEQLLFTPTGRSTSAEISSSWPHPSFTGDILPLYSNIQDSGFTARWKSTSIKRNFPQQWKEDAFQLNTYHREDVVHAGNNINQSAFGVNLFVPVNGYQKTMRSIKYAALCILLTFASFFLIEITNKRSVHPFQYGLIGLALVLFYTLLLSISEYIGFNPAYIIASVCTIGLIAWFVKGILSSGRLTLILSLILVLMYSYIFTLLQLQDYSLLLGSIGLFITLAIIMHFSKKIQW